MNQNVQSEQKAGGMHRRTKRLVAAAIAVLLMVTLSTTALADGGKSAGTGGGQAQAGGAGGQNDGQAPSDGQNDSQGGNRGAEMGGINVDKIEEAIAALDDESVQTSLTALLDAYVSATEARQEAIASGETDLDELATAAAAAKTALDAALEEAGVSTDDLYSVPEQANDGTGRMENRSALDADAIAEEIAALEDSNEYKESLTTLLSAYQTALEAKNGADSSLSDDEQKALNDALTTAEQALQEALKNAGLSDELQEQNQQQFQTQNGTATQAQTGDAAGQGTSDETAGDTGTTEADSSNLFSAFFQWFRSLLN